MEKTYPKFIKVFQKLAGPTRTYLNTALELNVLITKKYTNKRYYEEIQGMAKGSGIPASEFAKINIFPEFVKAACTVAGLWGPAT